MNAPTSPSSQPTLTRLPDRWRNPVRLIWLAFVGLTVALFVMGIPISYAKALRLTPALRGWLAASSLPLDFPANALIGLDIATFAFFTAMALLLFWRKSEDWIALLVALLFVTTAGIYSSPINDAPVPLWLAALPIGLGEMVQAAFVYLFPDGRFVPKWSRWLLLPMLIWRPAMWIITYLPLYKEAYPALTAQTYGFVQQDPIDIGLFLACMLIGVGGQVYRYRRLSTPEQRQQAKWVLYGVSLTVIVVGVWVLAFNVFQLGPTDSFIAYLSVRVFRQLALAIVPVVFAISILRYRLWDIDFVINRSLVYGALALVLAAAFGGVLLATRPLILLLAGDRFTGAGIVVAAMVAGSLYRPLLARLRRFVDRRFYGIQMDYERALQAYASREYRVYATPGDRAAFGKFNDLVPLGKGGMGEVYMAQHPALKKTVAIKLLPPRLLDDQDARARFLREAEMLAALNHPHIIKIHEHGQIDNQPYIVMDYIDGKPLDVIIEKRGGLPLNEAMGIVKAIAAALDYAHAQGIVHRDIKPGNIMISSLPLQGENPTPTLPLQGEGANRRFVGGGVILMDFGIAKSQDSQSGQITGAGIMGTLDYIAPEQISRAAQVDARADVYSFGVMAYQMFTGQLPFRYNNPGALVLAHLNQPAPDPRRLTPELPEDTAVAVMQAMSKKPEYRYRSAGAMVAAMG
jgi:hypothetical protein